MPLHCFTTMLNAARDGATIIRQSLAYMKYRRHVGGVFRGRGGIRYVIDDRFAMDMHIVAHGIYDDWIAQELSCLIPKEGVVIDVGANVGHLSLPFAMLHVPAGRVFAVEPDERNYNKLLANIAANHIDNIAAFRVAFQEDPTTVETTFFVASQRGLFGVENTGVSSLHKDDDETIATVAVPATTLDRFLTEHNITRLDFLKLDVEGAEHRVLCGGLTSIRTYRPCILYEYSHLLEKKFDNTNSRQAFYLLQSLGYRQFLIVGERRFRELTDCDDSISLANVLCLHPSCFSAERIKTITGI